MSEAMLSLEHPVRSGIGSRVGIYNCVEYRERGEIYCVIVWYNSYCYMLDIDIDSDRQRQI